MRADRLPKYLSLLLAAALPAMPAPVSAADGHIDPSTIAHRHNLTIARHRDTSFSLSTATSGVAAMSTLLQTCNSQVSSTQDVAAGVTVAISGALASFGSAGDGLDIITTDAEMSQVLASNAGHIKVVTKINYCGKPGPAAGCAPSGATMVIEAGLGTANTGETIVHELGHNKGLDHRDSPGNPIMKTAEFGGNEVDQTETGAFHAGGTADGKHRSVELAFVIDDTGSMSQEIAGVRGALTSHLAGFTANDCKAFQLTTFKDNVSPRAPTTDLATIRGAVAGLSASGGGDCPEASAEAIAQVQDEIRSRGRMLLATDASPHAGQSLAGTISALRGRGVRVDVLLSGDCVAADPAAAHVISHNAAAENIATPAGTTSAIAAYAELAEQTGGVFAYVPEVNSNASGRQRYENIGYNVMQSTQVPALILAQPGAAPRNARVSVLVQGGNTNFVPGTTLTVSGSGVTVESVVVRSATELVATLAVAADAPLGFRDLSAISGTESALGVGTMEIAAAASVPTITSIFANSARPGATLEVTVLGAGTHFGASSVLDVGAGITATNIRASSPQMLQATLQVASNASVGFRDVRVTSGTEIATESITGPFFVAPAPGGAVPALTQISPSTAARGTTLTLAITGTNTHFAESSVLSFSGSGIVVQNVNVTSATQLSAVVAIAPDAALGFRDAQVTSGSEIAAVLSGLQITGGAPPQTVVPVPLLSPLTLALLAGALLLVAGWARRRNRQPR